MMKRALVGMCLAGVLFGCKPSKMKDYDHVTDEATVADGDARVDGTIGDASLLNPILEGDSASDDIVSLVFNSLLRYDPKFQLEGSLASSWEVQKGGLRLVFRLRPNVKWHDGQPFTSADCLFTYQAIMDPKLATPRKGPFELVEKVSAPDAQTFVVDYKKPFAPALDSWAGMSIAPKHLLEGKDISKSDFNRNPVGTGPFKFVRWAPNQEIELAANPDYYEGKPHLKRYLYRIIPDETTMLSELKTQGIDTMALKPDQYMKETADPRFVAAFNKYKYPNISTYSYFGFNLEKPMFQDKRVRKALSHAIDRKALVDLILLGLGRPCSGPYSPLVPAYNQAVQPVTYDLKLAGDLLDQAGWKLNAKGIREKDGQPMKFNISTNKGNKIREDVATVLQEQFKKLGVQTEVQVIEWSVYVQNYLDKKNFDTVVMGWQLGLDPDLYDIWHSSKTHEAEFNFVSFKNAECDRLLEQGRTTFDLKKRLDIYHRLHALLAEEEPVAFLFSGDDLSALHKRFRGLLKNDAGYTWEWPTRWYVPKSVQMYP
jgi:peptide/nickel transport system substrate-binding protein